MFQKKISSDMNIRFGTTCRGFSICEFNDYYGVPCSLQESSCATIDQIWLGVNNPHPQVMASVAYENGYPNPTNERNGWIPYEIPEDVLIYTRMLLSRKQARELAKILNRFARTGYIERGEGY